MNSLSSSQRATHIALAAGLAVGLASLSGCGIGNLTVPNSTATTGARTSGTIHGGLSPVTGATVTIYATGDSGGNSAGYGIGNSLQTAVSDSNGGFQFAGGYTCPANQYAYLVATGGKTGSNAVNPNSILMAALGPCSGVSASTFTLINELTTIAAGYALSNFMTVSGDAVHGYAVGIGAPATNNAAAGCVTNAYYSGCTTTSAAGLRHAFVNATALVNTTNGQPNATTSAGAIVPVPFLNTLGNVLQACVNSSGGGTDPTTGQPNISFSAQGTTNDGTTCGKLFAYTSYTGNGTPTQTLVAAGNTLSAVQNLAKRPSGSATMFDSNCSSTAGTANNAATCIYNLATPVGVFQPSMTAAPPDWMFGISYPKGSFSTSTTANTFATACSNSYTGNGLLYPTSVSTDINDQVVIFNPDGSTPACSDIIVIGSDGTNLGLSTINTASAGAVYVGVDAWGHAILPLRTGNGILFYQYGAGGTSDPADSSIPQVFSITSTGANSSPATTTVANKPQFVQADSNSRIYVSAANSQNTFGYLSPSTLSHTVPVYTAASFTTTTTSTLTGNTIDVNNNDFATKTTLPVGAPASGTTFTTGPASLGTSTNGQAIVTDTSNNAWLLTTNGTTLGTSQTMVLKFPYTVTGGVLAFGANATATSPTYAFPTNTSAALNDGLSSSIKYAVMDGNNVMWWGDAFPSTAAGTGGYLRGYDTVNNYGTNQLQGCKFYPSGSYTVTGWTIGASTTTFTLSNSSPPVVNAVLTLNGFATSTFFNGQQVTETADTTTSPITITVNSTFGQPPSSGTEAGTAAGRTPTTCGNNIGDTSYPSNTPFVVYGTRGIAIDTMGNIWVANGTQGQVNEILGLAAPTLPSYIHNGTSNKP